MKNLLAIGFLIFAGVAATLLAVPLLNIAGLPGALICNSSPTRNSSLRVLSGTFLSIIGQSYVYLAYTAFVVNWTILAISHQGLISFLLWPISFLAVTVPILRASLGGIREDIEDREQTSQVQLNAVSWTTFLAPIAFFVFIFMPGVMRLIYDWIPFIRS